MCKDFVKKSLKQVFDEMKHVWVRDKNWKKLADQFLIFRYLIERISVWSFLQVSTFLNEGFYSNRKEKLMILFTIYNLFNPILEGGGGKFAPPAGFFLI